MNKHAKNNGNTIIGLFFTYVLLYALYYVRGKCPYHHDVLILDTMLALKHAFYIQILKLYFSLFTV